MDALDCAHAPSARAHLLSFRLGALSLYTQSNVREEVSQSHGGKPPFWSGNRVGASPYVAAYFGVPVLRQIAGELTRRTSENPIQAKFAEPCFQALR